ncbi:MAG: hypothetical protein QN721_10185, partial [Nitrososphaeraceae archaeon]|nr:hypothetical protein [Nitrososphaeraceae archaeon]MDW0262622.1 hypothetical protein [Nitrososphaeraceae archaeon]MDW0278453.1 hypothetical protein [Nitrososphaeraceae archaeon]MDW0321838.1 hypothetical protein [Nitrososphaeraceae archaeon]
RCPQCREQLQRFFESGVSALSQHSVCTYCLHPKKEHVYYVGQIDNKHPCRVCDCNCFKSM